MIDKKKTIQKAIVRYHLIYPVRGKQHLEECFFCMRGEQYLVFRTKDKKVHKVKACMARQVHAVPGVPSDTFNNIFKMLNKPIVVRSVLAKKPVKACIINLFPVPGISWSTMGEEADTSVPVALPPRRVAARTPQTPHVELTAPSGITTSYPSGTQSIPASHTDYPAMRKVLNKRKSFYHLEVIAPGYFPVTIDREMFMPQKHADGVPVRQPVVNTAMETPPPAAKSQYVWPMYDER